MAAERTAAVPGARAAASDDLARPSFAALATIVPLVVEELLVRRAGAYLLGARPLAHAVLAVHLGAVAVFAVLAARARIVPPWRAARLLVALGATSAIAHVGSLVAFADAGVFPVFALVVAALVGASLGALAVTIVRQLRGMRIAWDAALDRVSPLTVLGGVTFVAIAVALADRAGPLRTGLASSIAAALAGHLGGRVAPRAPESIGTRRLAASLAGVLAASLVFVDPIAPWLETPRLPDPLVFAKNTEDHRFVLTSGRGAFQLYVDGLLRLSTLDSARRRESLVVPVLAAAERRERILLVGGGDGSTAREILRHGDVRSLVVVEPERGLVDVARRQLVAVRESGAALDDPRVRVVEGDPLVLLRDDPALYDVAIVDVLEPDTPARSKLYTSYFYRLVGARLAEGGVGVVSGPSPFAARRAFWCIERTLRNASLATRPYRASLPSVGVAGFVLFAHAPIARPSHVALDVTYVDDATLADLFALAPDEARVDVEPNLLHRQILLRYRDEAAP